MASGQAKHGKEKTEERGEWAGQVRSSISLLGAQEKSPCSEQLQLRLIPARSRTATPSTVASPSSPRCLCLLCFSPALLLPHHHRLCPSSPACRGSVCLFHLPTHRCPHRVVPHRVAELHPRFPALQVKPEHRQNADGAIHSCVRQSQQRDPSTPRWVTAAPPHQRLTARSWLHAGSSSEEMQGVLLLLAYCRSLLFALQSHQTCSTYSMLYLVTACLPASTHRVSPRAALLLPPMPPLLLPSLRPALLMPPIRQVSPIPAGGRCWDSAELSVPLPHRFVAPDPSHLVSYPCTCPGTAGLPTWCGLYIRDPAARVSGNRRACSASMEP